MEASKLSSPFKYFSYAEFDSPDLEGSGEKMNFDFVNKLDKARDIAKIPFVINSGYRTLLHNKKVGGVENSSHTKGLAADIRTTNENEKKIIAKGLYEVGFIRLGFGQNFIHVDLDFSKPQLAFNYNNEKIYTYSDLT